MCEHHFIVNLNIKLRFMLPGSLIYINISERSSV